MVVGQGRPLVIVLKGDHRSFRGCPYYLRRLSDLYHDCKGHRLFLTFNTNLIDFNEENYTFELVCGSVVFINGPQMDQSQ